MEEKDIIAGCKRNDRRAQKALYERYKKRMYTLAYRITNDFEDANDVLQEGFVDVFRGLQKFEGKSKLSTWIHTIIMRRAIKKVKGRMYFDDVDQVADTRSVDWGSSIDIDHLEKAIHDLPTGYRTVFTMVEIEGYKHREVADMLNISINSSKSQLFKAKRKLRDALSEYAV